MWLNVVLGKYLLLGGLLATPWIAFLAYQLHIANIDCVNVLIGILAKSRSKPTHKLASRVHIRRLDIVDLYIRIFNANRNAEHLRAPVYQLTR